MMSTLPETAGLGVTSNVVVLSACPTYRTLLDGTVAVTAPAVALT
jgi:hypothetical protein